MLNICGKFHENISNGFDVTERKEYVVEMAIFNIQRAITPKNAIQSYGFCAMHVVSWCLIFV